VADSETPAARLPLVTDPAMLDEIKERTGRLANLTRVLAHSPALMRASYDMALVIRNEFTLPRALVELLILHTAQLTNSTYEWWQHVPMALASGVSQDQIDQLTNWRTSNAFSESERAALAYCDKAATNSEAGDQEFALLRRHFNDRQVVEIAAVICHYVGLAHLIRALGVQVEAGR
jgi:alkylhydroperoxidase family enzyme